MMKITLESRLYRTCVIIYKILKINLLLIIFSAGVVTFSAALSAAFYTTEKSILSGEDEVFEYFFSSFKSNLFKSFVLFAVMSFSVLFCRMAYLQFYGTGPVISFMYWLAALFIFSFNIMNHLILARIEMPVFNVLKYSLFLNFVYILLSMLSGLATVLAFIVFEKISFLLLILIGPVTPVLVYSYLYKDRLLFFLRKNE